MLVIPQFKDPRPSFVTELLSNYAVCVLLVGHALIPYKYLFHRRSTTHANAVQFTHVTPHQPQTPRHQGHSLTHMHPCTERDISISQLTHTYTSTHASLALDPNPASPHHPPTHPLAVLTILYIADSGGNEVLHVHTPVVVHTDSQEGK